MTYDDNGSVIPLSERFNENERDIRYSKKNKIEKPKKKACNETETNFMIWSNSESAEVGSYRWFKRFGKFRYKKSEDGVIEVSREEYDDARQKRRDSHYGQARDNVYGTSDQVRFESGGCHSDLDVSGHSGEDIEIARRDGGEQLQNESSGNIKRDRENTGGLPDGGVKPSRRIRTTAEIISELGEKNEVLDEFFKEKGRSVFVYDEAYDDTKIKRIAHEDGLNETKKISDAVMDNSKEIVADNLNKVNMHSGRSNSDNESSGGRGTGSRGDVEAVRESV